MFSFSDTDSRTPRGVDDFARTVSIAQYQQVVNDGKRAQNVRRSHVECII